MNTGSIGRFEPNLLEEMDKFQAADLVIWHFPMWWFSLPAILKGYADRVLATGRFKGGAVGIYKPHGKKAVLCFTTGGSSASYEADGL